MAKYDILGDIVSPEALAQLKELEKIANNIGGKLKGITLAGMSDKGEAAFIQKLNAETALLDKQKEKLTRTIEKENVQAQRRIKLTQEEAVTQAALNNVSKLRAVLASQETSALQKLDAQIRLNVLDAQKYVAAGDTQNANYLKLIANTKQLSMEYDRMAKASGSNMVKTQSMYGATFQLTQVMRELPNFAIDARIGFMALSNNLPMLIDSFKNLSQEIDVNTGKMYGFGGALKQFGKSLLSMNTIMIVLSTLLILMPQIIDLFTKINVKAQAFVDIMKKVNDSTFQKAASDQEKILKFAVTYYDAVKRGDADRIKQLEDIAKKEYNVNADRLKAIGDNVNNWREAFKEYIKMAQITYANEARIKAGVDAEFESKKQAAEKRSIYNLAKQAEYQKQLKAASDYSRYLPSGVTPQQYAQQQIEKMESEPDFKGFDVPRQFRDRWKELNKEIEKTNAELGILKDIPVTAVNMLDEITPNGSGGSDKVDRDRTVNLDPLRYKFPRPETITTEGINMPAMASIFNIDAAAIDKVLSNTIEKYENGLITFQEFEADKNRLIQEAADKGVFITEENQNKIAQIIAEKDQIIKDAQIEALQSLVDNMAAIWGAYFDYMNEKLEEQADKQAKIEDEKYKDIEDREKAGIITKQEAEEEKLRTEAYYDSVQEEIDRKQKENDNRSFLIEQAAALAQVWINFGLATASLENMLLGGALTPLYATIAGASTALILAQSIPAFEQGGIVAKDGTILAGEKRHELAILPDGSFFVTANRPTLYDVPKGTEIMPDLNKIDIMDILHLKPLYANHSEDKQLIREMQNVTRAIKTQKQGNFYGMPLIKQLDSRGRFDNRRKSLMN